MVDLTINYAGATGGGCGCGGCGCGGDTQSTPAQEPQADSGSEAAASCSCGPDCTCGCQEGKPCTCGSEAAASCSCGPDCTCGCQEGKPCTCGDPEGADPAPSSGGLVANYTVTGMTCGHCVKAITEEVSAIEGVDDVTVDLETGNLAVTSDRPIDFDRIVGAVAEAGDYTVS